MKRSLMYLQDMVESMRRIDLYTENSNYEEFIGNQMLIDAVIRNLEVIGEAARNVNDEIRNNYPEIPWRNMIGLRNILIHEYFGVDESIVWEIIKNNLPGTKTDLLKVIQEVSS